MNPSRVTDLLAAAAARRPNAPALVDSGGAWSYGDLMTVVGATADWLRGLGVDAGDRVPIVGENGRTLVALLFAILSVGAWAVPASVPWSRPRASRRARATRWPC